MMVEKGKRSTIVPGVPDDRLTEVEQLFQQRAKKKADKSCKIPEKKGKAVTAKCDTVEPTAPKRKPVMRLRTNLAALFLILVMILGLVNALSVLYEGMQYKTPQETLSNSSGTVYGRVTDDKGVGIDGATVTLQGTSYKAMSDPDGWYFIGSVPVKQYRVEADRANYTSMVKDIKVEEQMPRPINFQLAKGTGTKYAGSAVTSELADLQPSYAYSAGAMAMASVFALIGVVLCIKRNYYWVAILCAAVGALSYGYLIGTFLSVLALLLIVVSRPAFVPEKPRFRETPIQKARTKTEEPVEDAEEATDEPEEPEPQPEMAESKTLKTRKAEQEIKATESTVKLPPTIEPIIDAEVKEKLISKGYESKEISSDDDGSEIKVLHKKKELRPVGPEVVGDMETALKDTMARSPSEADTDIVASVLKKLELDRPVPSVQPPSKIPKRRPKPHVHEDRILCRKCVKPIILEEESVKCKCGRVYHVHCAKDIVNCRNCGRPLKLN
jgi:hypothetical protein